MATQLTDTTTPTLTAYCDALRVTLGRRSAVSAVLVPFVLPPATAIAPATFHAWLDTTVVVWRRSIHRNLSRGYHISRPREPLLTDHRAALFTSVAPPLPPSSSASRASASYIAASSAFALAIPTLAFTALASAVVISTAIVASTKGFL